MAKEAIGALRWYLEMDGIDSGIFRKVSGFDSETVVIEHRVTGKGGNLIVHKVPGELKWSNLVLERAITDDTRLHDWRKKIEDGQIEANRKNGTITCYAPDNTVVAKYSFKRAWPVKWSGPGFDASTSSLATETIELAHEGLTRQQ